MTIVVKEALNQLGITYPPVTPIPAPPNKTHLGEWANAQKSPMLRQIALKIIHNLNNDFASGYSIL